MTTKTCTKCGETKPLDGFHRDKSKRDGRLPQCKQCAIKRVRAWTADNAQKTRESQALYRAANRRHLAEESRRYKKENPHVWWAANYRQRCKRLGIAARVEHFTELDVIERYGGSCFYCGGEFQELDHYIPLSKEGAHTLDNVRPACHSCNDNKRSADPEEWLVQKKGTA